LKDRHYRTLLHSEILGHEIADEHGDLVPLFHASAGVGKEDELVEPRY
jgi:hypothetical protein